MSLPHHSSTPVGIALHAKKRWLPWVIGISVLSIITALFFTGIIPNPLATKLREKIAKTNDTAALPTVKVIKPKKAKALEITADQMALIEPYHLAELRARTSGTVKKVHFDIGDPVKKDDILIEIDVPELTEDVEKCKAQVLQREIELKVSRAKLKDSQAARDVSAATIKQRKADAQGAIAIRDFKQRKLDRFKELAKKGSVVESLVEEEERDFLASEAAVTSAQANVERAQADFAESESKVEAANADIELKQAFILIAQKELERTKAMLEYSRVHAPFDGVVIRRRVDPGSFVQNATSGSSDALITVARVDLVTISARFPDSVAPSIHADIPALITVDDLTGVTISSKVTRYAPSVLNADRTMRVEVDLFNGTDEQYEKLVAAVQAKDPNRPTKGINDPVPVRAFAKGANVAKRLLPGMTAKMRISTESLGDAFAIPSTAIYNRSGVSYIMIVKDGKTKQLPVRVQLNDGQTAKISIIVKRTENQINTSEVLQELTGDELIVTNKQLEIGDGTDVKTAETNW